MPFSSAQPSHPVAPCQSEARSDDGSHQCHSHHYPELGACLLRRNKLIWIVRKSRRVEVGKISCAEDPVSRSRGDEKIRERPLGSEEAKHEGRSSQSCLRPSTSLPGFVQYQVNNDGGYNEQQREA